MNKLDLLKRLNRNLNPDGTSVDFSEFDNQVAKLKQALKEKIQVKTVDDVNAQLDKFRRRIDIQPLIDSIENIRGTHEQALSILSQQLDSKTTELENLVNEAVKKDDEDDNAREQNLRTEIDDIKSQISVIKKNRTNDLTDLEERLKEIKRIENKFDTEAEQIKSSVISLSKRVDDDSDEDKKIVSDINKTIEELRKNVFNAINNIGGGSMNRQMFIGGADALAKYSDVNFKAGSNVTITYVNNDTTKKTDVTFTSTGGSGTVRSINSVAINTTAGATAGTDYVYLVTGTTQITMPTAVGNTNLYTIKNVGTGVVTIVFNGVETCDGDTSIVMPVRYTSVDLISDTANWNVT